MPRSLFYLGQALKHAGSVAIKEKVALGLGLAKEQEQDYGYMQRQRQQQQRLEGWDGGNFDWSWQDVTWMPLHFYLVQTGEL
jgi:hypothetical protein